MAVYPFTLISELHTLKNIRRFYGNNWQPAASPFPVIFLQAVGWLVGYFGLNGTLRQYFYIGPSPREREKEKRSDR